jgi:iron complex transport system substrate-binding protein
MSRFGLRVKGRWPGAVALCAMIFCASGARAFAGSGLRLADEQQEAAAGKAQDAAKDPAKTETRIVVDESGRRVTLPVNIQRIVSLAPNLTETIYALGLENKLVGDTINCDTPAAAKEKAHIGTPLSPSLEAIVALHPDVVLATAVNRWETVHELERLGIPVYTTDPHTVRDILDSTMLLGDLLGGHDAATVVVAKMQSRLDDLQKSLKERPLVHVVLLVWQTPPITIGQNTFIADALRWAGAESALVSDKDWPQISIEEIVQLAPEYILLTRDHSEASDAQQIEDLRKQATWSQLEPVKLGRVVVVSDAMDRPSPGMIEPIVELAHRLHPEVFGTPEKAAPEATGQSSSQNMERWKCDCGGDLRAQAGEKGAACAL